MRPLHVEILGVCSSQSAPYSDPSAPIAMIPNVDVQFAIRTFQELGAPHGLILNLYKTKILMTLDPAVPAEDPDFLATRPWLDLLEPAYCLSRRTV